MNNATEILQIPGITRCEPVGSKTFLPDAADEDYIAYSESWLDSTCQLINTGYELGGSVPGDELEQEKMTSDFISLKCGQINIILTSNLDFYKRFIAANDFAKFFYEKHRMFELKEDRVALFQLALYGNSPIKGGDWL